MKKIFVVALALVCASSVHAQKYGANPEDSISCLQNLSVYQEFFKQKNYTDAYGAWKKVLELCPTSSKNNFIRGNTILKNMIAKEKDATVRGKYIDELVNLWDLRRQYFGETGFCLGMKAADMRTYRPKNIKEYLEVYNQAMEYVEESAKVKNFENIPEMYFGACCDAFKAGLMDKEALINAYDQASTALETIAKMNPANDKISERENGLNALFEPYAACQDLIPIYTKKFETASSDVNFLKKATRMLNLRSCTDSEIFFNMTEALYGLEPTPQSAYMMAKMCYSKGDQAKAVAYLTADVIDQLEAESDKENAYLLLGDAYMKLNRFGEARNACNKALEINPASGKAYMLLGMVYAAGAGNCKGDGTPVAARAPYWAAVDMFVKARNVDPSLAETVGKLVSTYSAHFPSADDLFTYGLKEGDTYTISCWFSHTTTIRASR
ncbi:MAG: tetratricopeptide repeat protein [Bacteroides sp.]|nr:tetratricopeptide repeat protein [Ruminococcus flavefaciens]MCM1555353.1 tetratricopeptide repeat protein [Bacteroides sp.]